MVFVSLMALTLSVSGLAQDVVTPPVPVATAQWNLISHSTTTAYLTDVSAIRQENGLTTAVIARVPTSGEAGDRTHSTSELTFRCSANQSRPGEEVYYGADGSVEERIPNDYDFEAVPPNSLDAYAKAIVCDGERSRRSFESVEAFIAAGRPTRE